MVAWPVRVSLCFKAWVEVGFLIRCGMAMGLDGLLLLSYESLSSKIVAMAVLPLSLPLLFLVSS